MVLDRDLHGGRRPVRNDTGVHRPDMDLRTPYAYRRRSGTPDNDLVFHDTDALKALGPPEGDLDHSCLLGLLPAHSTPTSASRYLSDRGRSEGTAEPFGVWVGQRRKVDLGHEIGRDRRPPGGAVNRLALRFALHCGDDRDLTTAKGRKEIGQTGQRPPCRQFL